MAPELSSAKAGQLLASITWDLAPLLAVQSSPAAASKRGYKLVSLDYSVTHSPQLTAGGAASGAQLKPASSSVSIKVTLPLQPFYSNTVLSERTSELQLLASITGLFGIFAVFKLLYGLLQSLQEWWAPRGAGGGKGGGRCWAARRGREQLTGPRRKAGGAAGSAEVEGSAQAVEGGNNPLLLSSRAALPGAVGGCAPAPALARWQRHQDAEGDVWFSCLSTGEVVWELPPGAWQRHQDAEGDVWFSCLSTGEVVWELPPGAVAVS
jgi:hypothetical protein